MTLGELKAKFYDLIGEDSSSLVNVTAATAGRLLNDAYREIARMTGAIEKIHVARVVSGTAEYTLPDDAGKIIRVAYDGERIWPHSALEMDAIDQYWETRSGQVDRYVTDRENNNVIRLYKNPDTNGAGASFSAETGKIVDIDDTTNTYTFSAETGIIVRMVTTDGSPVWSFSTNTGKIVDVDSYEDNLEVWYKVDPADMAEDGDTPLTPSWSHLAIAFQAAKEYLLNETEGGNEGLSDLYGQMAEDYITRLRVTVSNRTPERTHYMNDRGALARPRGMGSAQLPSNYPRYYG